MVAVRRHRPRRGLVKRRPPARQRTRRGDLVVLAYEERMSEDKLARIRAQTDILTARTGVLFVVLDRGVDVHIAQGRGRRR